MDVLRFNLVLVIIIHFHITRSFGYSRKCECDSVRDILRDEIFELKVVNKELTSRLEKVESIIHGNFPIAGSTSNVDTDRLEALETKVAAVESKVHDRVKYARNSLELNRLITKAMSAEKTKRIMAERKIEEGLKKINESLKDFNMEIDARFGSHANNISNQIKEYKELLSENVSHVQRNVQTIHATVGNLEHRTKELIERTLATIENDIDVISKDVSKMDVDINDIIDIVLLDQKATCEPNCTNGGVCFQANNCRCKPFTDGESCEKFICKDECYKNGGKCVGPGECKCPQGRSGSNCEHDDCVLPYEIDDRLSVTDRSRVVSLSGGSKVKNGEHVFFNCSNVDEQKYEPVNRRFICESGQWIEDEKDPNWKLGYNGQFPECRLAICEPNCQNGGVCYKDGICRCKHLTKGERCETVLCDDKCAANGGKCLAGDCQCPMVRFGPYCEKEGCSLPADGVKPKIRKIIYKPGDKISDFDCGLGYMLSSHDGMTCKDDGSWSNIVYCIKAAVYLISVKTVDASFSEGAGTGAKVYIYLHGQHGKTRRIYIRGNFEAGDLDETRVIARDVRPITEVVVGLDGRIIKDDWYLEFASIYVESVNEYYVFRPDNHIWITDTDDVTLSKFGNCISTFDSGHKWYPKWEQIGQKINIGRGDKMTQRRCQQKCTELTAIYCQSVVYNINYKSCWGFAVSSENFFKPMYGPWNSPVYLRNCK